MDPTAHAELARAPERRARPMVAEGREQGLEGFRAWLARPDRRTY